MSAVFILERDEPQPGGPPLKTVLGTYDTQQEAKDVNGGLDWQPLPNYPGTLAATVTYTITEYALPS